MNSPEWITLLIGCIACVLNGVGQPVFAILLTKIINVSIYPDISTSSITQSTFAIHYCLR